MSAPSLPVNGQVRDQGFIKTHWEQLYTKIDQIGEGTFGEVFVARHKDSGQVCAIKRLKLDKEQEGFPLTSVREIKLLKKQQNKNIVRLIDVLCSDEPMEVCLVFERLEHDLFGLLKEHRNVFSEGIIKLYFWQLLEGLYFLHHQHIVHRDLKPSNLLANNNGDLKICDFGLARSVKKEDDRMTPKVITLWYRPPELLFGDLPYTELVDMWSAGCILAEMFLGRPLFAATKESSTEQMHLIFKLCGSPTAENWPSLPPKHVPIPPPFPRVLVEHLKREKVPDLAIDLIDRLLVLDPNQRMKAADALEHDWLYLDPLPEVARKTLPRLPPSCEYKYKEKKLKLHMYQQQQQQQQHRLQPQHPHGHAHGPQVHHPHQNRVPSRLGGGPPGRPGFGRGPPHPHHHHPYAQPMRPPAPARVSPVPGVPSPPDHAVTPPPALSTASPAPPGLAHAARGSRWGPQTQQHVAQQQFIAGGSPQMASSPGGSTPGTPARSAATQQNRYKDFMRQKKLERQAAAQSGGTPTDTQMRTQASPIQPSPTMPFPQPQQLPSQPHPTAQPHAQQQQQQHHLGKRPYGADVVVNASHGPPFPSTSNGSLPPSTLAAPQPTVQ